MSGLGAGLVCGWATSFAQALAVAAVLAWTLALEFLFAPTLLSVSPSLSAQVSVASEVFAGVPAFGA